MGNWLSSAMAWRGGRMNYLNLLKNKGHQRLWLVASICWLLAAGFIFWEPLPEHQPVDVSQEASDMCHGEERAKAEVAGDEAYKACIVKNKSDSGTTPDGLSGTTAGLTKAICNTQRSAAFAEDLAKRNSDESECMMGKAEQLGQAQQPEADRLTDNLRIEKLGRWAAITLLPPILLPLSILLLLYGISAAMKWITAGYRDEK
jgi:hypothetical protein